MYERLLKVRVQNFTSENDTDQNLTQVTQVSSKQQLSVK